MASNRGINPASMGWDVFVQDENLWRRHHVISAKDHEDAARQVAESLDSGGYFYVCAASLGFEFTGEPVSAFRMTMVREEPHA